MSVASLTKSSTARSAWVLRSAVRFSRDKVWTAEMPVSDLLTYIVVSSGWSKPVWYFSATTRMRYSRCPAPPARAALSSARVYANAFGSALSESPPFSFGSVVSSPSRVSEPENATRTPRSGYLVS